MDTAALRTAAQRFDTAADLLAGASRRRMQFDGGIAGRMHTVHGDALRSALDRLAAQMAQWSRAAEELACALRTTTDRYGDAELRAAGQ